MKTHIPLCTTALFALAKLATPASLLKQLTAYRKYLPALLTVLLMAADDLTVYSQTFIWDNTGGNNLWSNAANWDDGFGGDPGTAPTAGSTVTFDATSVANCTIDVTTASVSSITIDALYTGIITQSGAVGITATTFSMANGTFTGGSGTITVSGTFSITGAGATFTSTTGNLNFSGTSFTNSAGTFTHNGGTVQVSAAAFTINNTPTFSTLVFINSTGGSCRTYTIATSITVAGTLRFNTGAGNTTRCIILNTGTINLTGNMDWLNPAAQGPPTGDGTATILINGAGDQTITGKTSAGAAGENPLPIVTVNKATGTLNLVNTFTVGGNFTHTAGTIAPGTSTVAFVNAINVNPGTTACFNNMTVVSGTTTLLTNPLNATTLTGSLTVSGGTLNNANLSIVGNANTLTVSNGATLQLTGTSSITTNFTTNTMGATSTVNYSGTTQNIASLGGSTYGILSLTGSLTKTLLATTAAVTFNPNAVTVATGGFNLNVSGAYTNTGSVVFSGGGALDVNGAFTNGAAATLDLGTTTSNFAGDFTNSGTAAISGSGAMTFDGTGAQSIAGTSIISPAVTFTNTGALTINGTQTFSGTTSVNAGAGSVTLGNSLTTFNNNFTLTTGTFAMGANDMTLNGNWTNNGGTFTSSAGAQVTFGGDASRTIGGTASTTFVDLNCNLGVTAGRTLTFNTACNITGVMDVNDGQIVTNGNITLVSNASGTAYLGNLSDGGPTNPAVSGNVICQRFINEAPTDNKFHLLSAQTTGGTLSDWNDDCFFAGTNFIGADYNGGSFNSVRTYVETTDDDGPDNNIATTGDNVTGFSGATNVTNSLNNDGSGTGSLAAGFMVYDLFAAETVDITGPVRSDAATVTFAVTLTANGTYDGNNLIGNPHPCAIDWGAMRANPGTTAILNANARIMTASGSYGNLTADATDIVASGEAIWVVATVAGNLTIEENDKAPLSADPYQTRLTGSSSLKRLTVQLKQGTYQDAPINLYFKDSYLDIPVSRGYDNLLDGERTLTNTLGRENLGFVVDNKNLDVSFVPDTVNQLTVPLRVWKASPQGVTKTYSLSITNVAEITANNKCFVFEDTQAGVSFPLTADTVYTITMNDTTYVPRFFLHMSAPISFLEKPSTCIGFNDGKIVAVGTGNGPFNYIWKNQAGDTIRSVISTNPDTLSSLISGNIYTVVVDNNGTCGTASASIELNSGDSCLTKLRLVDCNKTLTTLNQPVYCNALPGAQNYEWQWTNITTGVTKTIQRGSASVNFLPAWVPGMEYGKTYSVAVRAMIDGIWLDYGDACTISTSANIPFTNVVSYNCGATLADLNQTIYCNSVLGATNYQWEWTNSSGFSKTVVRGSSSTSFAPTMVSGIAYNTTYSVRVRAKAGDVWGNYGKTCQVTTPSNIPATKVRSADCGIILGSMSQAVYCNRVNGANNYEWEWTRAADGFVKKVLRGNQGTNFYPGWVAGLGYGKTYDVRVKARVNSTWGDYGTVCQVTMPASQKIGDTKIPDTEIPENSDKSSTILSLEENQQSPISNRQSSISLYPNPSDGRLLFATLADMEQESGNAKVAVFDALGKVVYQDKVPLANGNQVVIDFERNLAKGMYVVNIMVGEKAFYQKMMVY